MEKQIEVIIVEPNKEPYVKSIDDSYETKKNIIGGCIEFMDNVNKLPTHIDLIVNEEYLLSDSEWTAEVTHYGFPKSIKGTMMFVSFNEDTGETISIDENYKDYILEEFSLEKREANRVKRIWNVCCNTLIKNGEDNGLLLAKEAFAQLYETYTISPKEIILAFKDKLTGYRKNTVELTAVENANDEIERLALTFSQRSLIYYAMEIRDEDYINNAVEKNPDVVLNIINTYQTLMDFKLEFEQFLLGEKDTWEYKLERIDTLIDGFKKGIIIFGIGSSSMKKEAIVYLEDCAKQIKQKNITNKIENKINHVGKQMQV